LQITRFQAKKGARYVTRISIKKNVIDCIIGKGVGLLTRTIPNDNVNKA